MTSKNPNDAQLSAILAAAIESGIPDTPLEQLSAALGLRDVSTEELALVLGVTDRRIYQLWQAGEIPEPRRAGRKYMFSLLDSVNGYIRFLKSVR